MINFNNIKELVINGNNITQLQVGSNIIWKKEQPTPPTPSSYDYQVYDTKEEFDTSLNIPYAYSYKDSKWYALNTNKQYEEYGIYEITDDINSITKYPNKLAVVGTIEYQYQNNRWVEVGTYESSFGEIGTLSRESFPSGSQFPLNFALKKTDVSDWFLLDIYGASGEVRINKMGSDWEYRVSMSRGTVTEDDEYYYFNKPEDYESDSVEVMDLMYWDEPITMYGGSTVVSVKYDKITYPYNNGYYYQTTDITPKGMNVMYNINGDYVTYNGESYIHTDENPYFEFECNNDGASNLYKNYSFETIYDINWNIIGKEETVFNQHLFCILSDKTFLGQTNSVIFNAVKAVYNIPNTVITLEKTFYNCYGLSSITIPESVTTIGANTFLNCYSLPSITIPSNVTSINGAAFSKCYFTNIDNKSTLEIPTNNWGANIINEVNEGVCTSGDTCVLFRPNIENLVLPSIVTSVSSKSFTGGINNVNKSLYINKECMILNVANNLFDSSTNNSLNSIIVNDKNGFYSSDNNCLLNKDKSMLYLVATPFTIPDSVTSIRPYSIYSNKTITSLTIPDSVTSIYNNAIVNCSALKSLTFGSNLKTIENSAISNCYILATVTINTIVPPKLSYNGIPNYVKIIYVPAESVDAYKSATNWSTYASKIQPIP